MVILTLNYPILRYFYPQVWVKLFGIIKYYTPHYILHQYFAFICSDLQIFSDSYWTKLFQCFEKYVLNYTSKKEPLSNAATHSYKKEMVNIDKIHLIYRGLNSIYLEIAYFPNLFSKDFSSWEPIQRKIFVLTI